MIQMQQRHLAILASALVIAGCNSSSSVELNLKPAFVGTVVQASYDGGTDDLLTAGLGKTGLQSATAPAIADANNPTAAELRRLAIHTNYRALMDMTTVGGYGLLYGPNVDAGGNVTAGEGKIAGTEYTAYVDDGSGSQNVTMLVQVPSTFNKNDPCIVAAPSSGSRGVYGAIGTAGEWGLKKGCAVAYTDKGSGAGVHDLATNTVNLQNGTRAGAAAAGKNSHFTAALTDAERAALLADRPNRIAVKHAHSQQNPEKDWGKNVLNTIEFAFYVINEQFAGNNGTLKTRDFKPDNTIVIASSVSNGGGASLAAAELDTTGLIDGVAVGEPQIQVAGPANTTLTVTRGATSLAGYGRTLYDYVTLANLYQPCAALSAQAAGAPSIAFLSAPTAANRCASLKAKGLLTSVTLEAQADESLNILLAAGWQQETIPLQVSHYVFATSGTAVMYANTYGRFSVKDHLCGFSYVPTGSDGKPAAYAPALLAKIFGTFNGVPPNSGINIVNNDDAVNGAILESISVSPSTGALDYNIDGALCLRNLYTGASAAAQRVQSGITEVKRGANLRGKPAIIVHGRADTLTPPAFTSRPYFGANKIVEGAASKLSYIEVTNAQHLDAFIGGGAVFAGYDTRMVPLHRYFNQAMDMLYANLKSGTALPGSQVVRTIPRGGVAGAAPQITAANVPPIAATPAVGDAITFANNTVTIPN
ncbi:MAG: D-(-)-3-hydroxybutyrate oligomer hydrolase [Betaproteobacteria bacterium]|nr:D-(-)-3-hydroxybutyrate oligomer hydrolase [Betaproteobacteria bacterium]